MVVIVDIDGTIANCSERAAKYLNGEHKDWDSFYSHCGEDKPIKPICDLVNKLARYYTIVFISGRRRSCYEETKKWIRANLPGVHFTAPIFLRNDNDFRHDIIVKPELLDKYLARTGKSKEDIAFFLEDRDSMVDKWRELGYTCLQVAPGNF